MSIHRFAEARREPRVSVMPMYTTLRARPKGARRYAWTGHIYDISRAGMRFELDNELPLGEAIEVRMTLPGSESKPIRLSGRVVRIIEEDDENGPIRMAMNFASFNTEVDANRLDHYLEARGLRRAAA